MTRKTLPGASQIIALTFVNRIKAVKIKSIVLYTEPSNVLLTYSNQSSFFLLRNKDTIADWNGWEWPTRYQTKVVAGSSLPDFTFQVDTTFHSLCHYVQHLAYLKRTEEYLLQLWRTWKRKLNLALTFKISYLKKFRA